MVHLSIRLSWHDVGWDGRVCIQPHLNASCVVNDNIRDHRDERLERAHAGKRIIDLDGWLPPCSRDITAYAPFSFPIVHSDPLERPFLRSITETLPPYTCLPAPYRWMREENFRNICEAEGLSIRSSDNLDKDRGWVYEPDRQRALLDQFWARVKEGEDEALIFFYVNHGNPINESATRLVVGVGRLKQVGPQLFFDGMDNRGELYPIWTRAITQDFPAQGFRLPYQEYISAGLDPNSIACYVPANALPWFSFVGEHVSDDIAVGVLERLIQSVKTIDHDSKVAGDWTRHLVWLNDRLSDVWRDRGPYPGIGSVLQYLGCPHGTAFHRLELRDCVRNGDNPWYLARAILDGQSQPPANYAASFRKARQRWNILKSNPTRIELLDTLVRFELTPDQVRRICDPEDRRTAGIAATDASLLANPYIICESDLGTATSAPVALETIDQGMRPGGNAALFISPEDTVAHDDARRVRAVAMATLSDAAQAGDTLVTFNDLLDRIRSRFPNQRACRPDRDVVIAEADFYREHLWLTLDTEPQLAGLKYLRTLESQVAQTIRQRAPRKNAAPNPPADWRTALRERFGAPADEREQAALEEKAQALQTLFERRVSVLTGSAGTGKTSTLKVFLDHLERIKGKTGVYLLAPTGKARVRLSTETKRNAFTIHQFLFKQNWFLPDLFVLKRDGGSQDYRPTVIIDECSMVPIDLLGTLFKALKLDLVERLILVGDPNQLPPIGPGRPFVDIVAWLREHHPECIATLRTTMRTADTADKNSVALAFADGYRGDSVSPADDELLSRIAREQSQGDLDVHFWRSHDELRNLLTQQMHKLLGIQNADYASFNRSLGITDQPWKQPNWKGAESWQILSPLRGQPFGTDEINRIIQLNYRGGLIQKAQQRSSKWPRPFGDEEIVYSDKVIQITNRRHRAWPQQDGNLDYVANGEIGIVTSADSYQGKDFLQIGFSTQEGVTYRYRRGEVDGNLELGYALTVHKAQGSDFDIVFLIIPQKAQTLSRELIYTGLTRFRKKLVLLIEHDVSVLEALRNPDRSDTHLRNTQMFDLSLRPDPRRADIPYPEALIHRTKTGVAVRSKSEIIVADVLESLGLAWEYERRLTIPDSPNDFRLPDFTIGFQGDTCYWEHLGMLSLPAYRQGWERKRRWYEERLGIPVVGPGAADDRTVEPGTFPIVITSRDGDNGSIDAREIERLARKYILLDS